jgi:flavin-dependent dehydrogenase
MRQSEHENDVVVVGARCAGAVTAMLLGRLSYRVTVVERGRIPSDTLSAHGIARGGVVQLAHWGLLGQVLASGAPAIRQVVFRADGTEEVRTVKPRDGVDHLVAPRRYILDRILAGAAVKAGATIHTGNGAWTWHSLRHVFCTTALFTWKLDATDVSRMAGHANYRITLDMYVGATAGVLDRARAATE